MNSNSDKNVLICDDEPHIRESIRYAVNKEGYSYKMVGDGIAAYEQACEYKPDLIVLDVGMPGMTGYEVCKRIRETPGMELTRVLILTAFGQTTDKDKAIEAGANDFMIKPFSPKDLRAKIKEILE